MLSKFEATAGQFRAAQTALAADDQCKADAALANALQEKEATNAAAQEYGMPPLDTCPDHVSGTSPAPAVGDRSTCERSLRSLTRDGGAL